MEYTSKPLAAPGLTSYRYPGRYGWVMIGATDRPDALREAARSTSDPIDPGLLEVWNGSGYVNTSKRLEYLRGEIEAERICYGEIAELQALVEYIEPGDVLLLQWAGVPEDSHSED